jgi:hypothetical protein
VKRWLIFVSFSVFLATASAFATGSSACPPIVFQWTDPETEIMNPTFSGDGSMIAFTARGHIPDAAEAESYDEHTLNRYIKSKAKVPGFDEPGLMVLRLGSETRTKGPLGWQPCFSRDGKEIYYVAQKNPISGLRILNDTLEGNGISVYDLASGGSHMLSQPDSGFDTSPAVGSDPSLVYFVHHEPGTGYWQTGVKFLSFNLHSRTQKVVDASSISNLYCSQHPTNRDPAVASSPNGKFKVEYWPELFEEQKPLTIHSSDGKLVCSYSSSGVVWEAAWSEDSSKLAFVYSTYNFRDPKAYKDHLVVFDLR